ncbi:MAG: PDZ domain-containing protein [Acidobacteria bacterium]|nr:PDZ domain-containing protein [Acidobacteriota bacterium]MCA1640991.1 PDZ domain-containing protein [Acidobacteriota bacterium]
MSRKQLLTLACGLAALVGCATVVLAQTATTVVRPAGQDEPARSLSMILGGGDNYLGVYTEPVTRENVSRLGLSGAPRGVAVGRVAENSPAAKAGLQKDDVILRFDGEQVTSTQKLSRLINESAPGHTARLTISRGGSERELSVTLGKREFMGGANAMKFENGELFRLEGDLWKKQTEEEARRQGEEWRKRADEQRKQVEGLRRQLETMPRAGGFALFGGAGRRIGVTTTQLTDQLADYFGVSRDGGVLVTSVTENSPAAKAGLKAGDVITEVDGEKIDDAAELSRLISRKQEGEVTLSVTRERNRRTFKVTPEKSQTPSTWAVPEGLFAAPAITTTPRVSTTTTIAPLRISPQALRRATIALPAKPALPSLAPTLRVRPATRYVPPRYVLLDL